MNIKYVVCYWLANGKKITDEENLFNTRIEAETFAGIERTQIELKDVISHEIYMRVV